MLVTRESTELATGQIPVDGVPMISLLVGISLQSVAQLPHKLQLPLLLLLRHLLQPRPAIVHRIGLCRIVEQCSVVIVTRESTSIATIPMVLVGVRLFSVLV